MNVALFLSGGAGRRMGINRPKQYIEVGGKPVYAYSLQRLSCHKMIDVIQIVAAPEWQEAILARLPEDDLEGKFRGFTQPGENRQLSILNGLKDIQEYASGDDIVFIHDAVRPMLTDQQITDCLKAVEGHDGVVPVLRMKDTVYISRDGKTITSLLNRGEIFAGQAPEAFCIQKYYTANLNLLPERILTINGAAEPAALASLDVVLIPGDEGNFKITTRTDLERFRELVGRAKK